MREGNRRVSALKLLCGFREFSGKKIPEELARLAQKVTSEWKKKNKKINCLVFDESPDDVKLLEQEIDNRHLSNQAGRVPWPTVHKAREEKRRYGTKNLALELLEKFFSYHEGLDEEWSPSFNLSVLVDFMSHLHCHLSYASKEDLVLDYPNEKTCDQIDVLLSLIYEEDKGSKINELQNRRSNGAAYLQETIPCDQLDENRDVQDRSFGEYSHGGGVDGGEAEEGGGIGGRLEKPIKKKPVNPTYESMNNILAHASRTGKKKLSDCCSELSSMVKSSASYPNASVILYRSILDYAMKHFIIKKGLTPKERAGTKNLVQVIYNNKWITEAKMLNALTQLNSNGTLLLNMFVHNEEFTAEKKDVDAIIGNTCSLLVHMLEVIAKPSSSSTGNGV